MAILISHIILADGVVTKKEHQKVMAFFEHLEALTQTLKNNTYAKAEILRHIKPVL